MQARVEWFVFWFLFDCIVMVLPKFCNIYILIVVLQWNEVFFLYSLNLFPKKKK